MLASAAKAGFRCVYVGSKGRLSAGFLPGADLVPAGPTPSIESQWLVGRWSDGNDLIVFSRKKGALFADGDGIWPGRNFAGPPGPNIGEFNAVTMIAGDRAMMDDGTCHVEAYRRGPYLIVADNQNCGGMNVRFKGIYVSGSSLQP